VLSLARTTVNQEARMEAKEFRRRHFLVQGGTAAAAGPSQCTFPRLVFPEPARRDGHSLGRSAAATAVRSFFAGRAEAMNDPLVANKRTYWESNGQVTRRVRIG
jgi:hypothetical protein